MAENRLIASIFGLVLITGVIAAGVFLLSLRNTTPATGTPGLEVERIAPPDQGGKRPGSSGAGSAAVMDLPTENKNEPPAAEEGREVMGDLARTIMVGELVDHYGADIDHPRTQLAAVLDLVKRLRLRYPDNWQEHVYAYVSAAFPAQADQLYMRFTDFQEFNQWVKGAHEMIMDMPAEERLAFIRMKREQFFGPEASLIWEQEYKDEGAAGVLETIANQSDTVFNDKTDYYVNQLEKIYEAPVEDYTPVQRQRVIDQFLSLKSVQADLKSLPPAERIDSLSALRRSLGMDEQAVRRLESLDRSRDESWQRGLQYMEQRQEAIKRLDGDALSQELDRLRRQHFGTGAETIREEEAAGFYRFNRERVFGKN